MQIVVDTHTHTLASGHAYSTLLENAAAAQRKGLKILCTTDHAPTMPGAPHYWFFNNQRIIPRFLNDVGIIRGVEANTLNTQGDIDIHPQTEQLLDWVITSFHEPVFAPASEADHTEALLNVIKSGRVDALGHLGNPNFGFDIEAVLTCAKEHNVAIEINNSSLLGHSRAGSIECCDAIARIGKEIGVYFTTGSDAHFCADIARLDLAAALLEKYQIDEEKIITSSTQRFLNFLLLRGKDPIEEFADLY
ncbi:phosphatase [Vibrio renipiscarius]|uniref:Hydrolase n=1 Tax=Vibrio renipiscarius TaxID=1461322 RepID=A0A0C2K7Z1_9VIBR|nr:phosphatase [Vibrio renipiscarius]KII76359.1 hydrolase [Vibrio renipiscarius]KII78118.1 hydrolase [Vibrio renipiscarius]